MVFGRFSPFLYLRSVAPLIPMESGHSSDFVLASPCSPRLPVFLGSPYFRDYRFPRAPLFFCSERKPW